MANNNRQKLCLPPPRSKEERDRCRRLFESDEEGYRAIHEATGVPVSTLRVWAKRDKWIAKSDTAIAPATPDADVEIPEDLPEQAAEYESNFRQAAVKFSRHVKNLPAAELAAKADRIKQMDGVSRKSLRIETEKPVPVINIGVLCGPAPVRSVPNKNDQGQLRSAHRPAQLIEAE